jgi:soluble lytic murein transglycosylase-like protein
MNYKNLFYTAFVSAIIFFALILKTPKSIPAPVSVKNDICMSSADVTQDGPPCLQMYYAIKKYAEEYDIPINYAFGISYAETRYQGPFHWTYNPKQTSCVGAIGPMQIMLPTGKGMWKGQNVTREMLMNDIDFNVQTSMKLLRKLFNKHKNWKLVFGAYNTGRPCVNSYAIMVYNYDMNFKRN